MSSYKMPINRSVFIGCALFIALLCSLQAVQSYLSASGALYGQYETRLRDAISFVERRADADDLAACVRSGVPSKHCEEMQRLLNDMIDPFELTYLYLVIPEDSPDGTLHALLSATSDAERAAGEEDWPILYDVSDSYTREEVRPLLEAWSAEDVVFFEGSSDWGLCYTGCKPLRASSGKTVALICADLSVEELHRNINSYMVRSAALTAAIGVVFWLLLVVWLQRNVTGPIHALERRARQFADSYLAGTGQDGKALDVSDIQPDNELQLLVNLFSSMSAQIENQAEDSASAKARAMSAEHEIEGMFRIAYQDALTHVKSKTAYNAKAAELTVDIAAKRAEFAIVMIDLNDLKKVNDTYGHENGDKYIIGACQIICTVYDHSPVYRIGGDEFVAVLQGRDYMDRDVLFRTLRQRIADAQNAEEHEPWERFSAATGMAVYDSDSDHSVDEVFRRADDLMYENKKLMKMDQRWSRRKNAVEFE